MIVAVSLPIDGQLLAQEAVRALRGELSQTALSRQLGYRSNVVHRWESGQCMPTAARFLSACERLTGNTSGAQRFLGHAPGWAGTEALSSVRGVFLLLKELAGAAQIGETAAALGVSRYRLARVLAGRAEPSLPFFLQLLDWFSKRALDFLALYIPVARLPSFGHLWRKIELARALAYEQPWSQAVLRALELDAASRWKSARWLSGRVGMQLEDVRAVLSKLVESGQVVERRNRYQLVGTMLLDTSRDQARARELRLRWCDAALGRLKAGHPGFFGYNVFAVSQADMKRLRDIQAQYLRAMQQVIANSERPECVGLFCSQLMDLDSGEQNAFR